MLNGREGGGREGGRGEGGRGEGEGGGREGVHEGQIDEEEDGDREGSKRNKGKLMSDIYCTSRKAKKHGLCTHCQSMTPSYYKNGMGLRHFPLLLMNITKLHFAF